MRSVGKKKDRTHPAPDQPDQAVGSAVSGKGLWRLGDNGGAHFRSEAEADAWLREHLGEEFVERRRRSRELLRDPQALDEADAAVLRAALAPVLHDLAATGMPLPEIREEAREAREWAVCGWIAGPGMFGQGINVMRNSPPAEQVRQLAEQFQNWAADVLVEARREPVWPVCQEHRVVQGLEAETRDDDQFAVWVCMSCDRVIAPIGELRKGTRSRPVGGG